MLTVHRLAVWHAVGHGSRCCEGSCRCLSFAVCGRAHYRLPIGLRPNDVGRPHDELHPAEGGLMDRSPILEYVLPEQGWQSLVHVLWLSDADCDAVAV